MGQRNQNPGKSPRTILRWIKGGKIPAEKIDGEWRVDVSGAVTTDRTGAADILAAKDKVIEILEAEIATLKAELAATNERLRESHILLQQRQRQSPGRPARTEKGLPKSAKVFEPLRTEVEAAPAIIRARQTPLVGILATLLASPPGLSLAGLRGMIY